MAGTVAAPALAQQPAATSKYAECPAGFQASQGDQDAAHGAFLAGKAAYDEADYQKAIDYFKDAYRRECTKHAVLNFIARAYEAKGDKPEAVNALETYVQRAPKADDAEAVKKRIENLKAAIAAQAAAAAAAPPKPAATPDPQPVAGAPAPASGGHSLAPWITVGVGGAALAAGVVLVAVGASNLSSARAGCTIVNGVYTTCSDGRPLSAHQTDSNSASSLATIGGVSSVGSLVTGWLGGKYPKHVLLGLLYILRSVMLAIYFVMPPTPVSTLLFAAVMGLLWWPGLVPLIGGLVADIFGTRYLATLLGISFVVHQVGSSLGAFGGGLIFDLYGSYDPAWQIGTLIGCGAGLLQIFAGGPTRPRNRVPTPVLATT